MASIHSVYAKIVDNTIVDIMVCNDYELANRIARATHGENAIALCIDDYSVGIGDKFHDNQFFSISDNGKEAIVNINPSQEEIIVEMKSQIEFLKFKAGVRDE